MSPKTNALEVLRQTSRTFYISIVRLPQPLRDAVMSSYLALRAIDEIEDHIQLDKPTKIGLLCSISNEFKRHPSHSAKRFSMLLERYESNLPEVTTRLDEWMELAPAATVSRICDATATMAQSMAYWVQNDWQIRTKRDLDCYTFSVAGSVGLLLSNLWTWYDGSQTSRKHAIAFGRGLQAVNILRNRPEDLARGVDFFPDGWMEYDIALYSRRNLARANAYVDSLPAGPVREFCVAPLTLAYATLDALGRGERKLNRNIVLSLTRRNSESHPNGSKAMEEVVLVNEKDEVVGTGEKIRTHQFGFLHRAFSTFIFNSEGQLLLQKRTSTKYHSRGLWSNTCCGHPRLNESTQEASRRRLREEMGFDCDLREVFSLFIRRSSKTG